MVSPSADGSSSGSGSGRDGSGDRSVSNSPLRDLEMLVEMEERAERSVSNSPMRDLEMLSEMVASGVIGSGDGSSTSSNHGDNEDNNVGPAQTTSRSVSNNPSPSLRKIQNQEEGYDY